ncbi:hypothetical protein K474DRAFT_480403 [Panus rudis PR-1116 ss-1]|nr:hypothetical protein K474DRAFT_480403 [Panus rudis PR-1116 ss-1]
MGPPPVPAHKLVDTNRLRVTMPGSLFPRSPSLEPEYASSLETEYYAGLAAEVVESRYERLNDVETEDEPSSPTEPPPSSITSPSPPAKSNKRQRLPAPDPESPSPIPLGGGPSVRQAASMFTADNADYSLMLPNPTLSSPHSSPTRPRSRTQSLEKPPPRSRPPSSKGKGKERARDVDSDHNPDVSGWDYDFSGPGETTSEIRVRGIEKELYAAREEHYRKEAERAESEVDFDSSVYLEERERDKERIKFLEEEVSRLRRQVRTRI